MPNPYQVVRDFEQAVADYTGAPFVVAVNSCTMALLLAVQWKLKYQINKRVFIPKRTYVSVPMSIIHAGGKVEFDDRNWFGSYTLDPLSIWDSARYFTGGMYQDFQASERHPTVCVSFHATKILGDTQGGAILHDNASADAWFRRMRFDGRTEGRKPKDDYFKELGWHCYMSPDVAVRLLLKLHSLPLDNAPLPNDDYPDLSQFEVFK